MNRNFAVTIRDLDGEEQEYKVVAPNAWTVCAHISVQMQAGGDFYGHVMNDTSTLHIDELVEDADMTNAITVRQP